MTLARADQARAGGGGSRRGVWELKRVAGCDGAVPDWLWQSVSPGIARMAG